MEQRHFDAWGNFTHLQIGNGAIITDKNIIDTTSLLLERGYTSHEHFAEVGIIHMNGRLYDPLLRRFLNADENIQDVFNTQNYNKYGYVMNNPLMFNDPSGEFIWFLGAAWAASHVFLAGVITAAVIGTAVGLAAYSLGVAISGGKWQLGGALKSMFWGGVSGAVTFGIGSVFTPAAGTILTLTDKVASAMAQGLVHGFAQGTLSLMQGANFTHGFASGASGSWGASLFGGLAGSFASSTTGTILSGAMLGGVASELTGGNFWEGVVIGGMVAGLNHTFHVIAGSGIEVDKATSKQFKSLVKGGDLRGAFDLVNSKYNLDAGIEGRYTIDFPEGQTTSGLTGGEAFATQEVTISRSIFGGSVSRFIRVVHHEFVHVFQRAVMGFAGNLSIYEVREFLAYHDMFFNDKIPKASYSDIEGYWHKSTTFYDYMTANPSLIKAYQSQYNDFTNSNYYKYNRK